jgi:hypothetical protein
VAKLIHSSSSFDNDIVILDGTSGTILDLLSKPTSQLELDAILVEDDNMSLWPEARGYADACVGMDGETNVYIWRIDSGGGMMIIIMDHRND